MQNEKVCLLREISKQKKSWKKCYQQNFSGILRVSFLLLYCVSIKQLITLLNGKKTNN